MLRLFELLSKCPKLVLLVLTAVLFDGPPGN